MNEETFYGVAVEHNGIKTTIFAIEDKYILLNEKNKIGNNLRLSYPGAFFETNVNKRFLTTKNEKLINKIKQDSIGHVCQECGIYYDEILPMRYQKERKIVCDACFNDIGNMYDSCTKCNKIVKRKAGGTDCAGNFLCDKCNEDRLHFRKVDLTKDRKKSSIYLYSKIPSQYKNSVEGIRAKVGFVNNSCCSIHEIDLFFYSKENIFMCLEKIFNFMCSQYGIMLFDIVDRREHLNCNFLLNKNDVDFKKDSILSRWNYIAQLDEQSELERRAIITALLYYRPDAKGEVELHLNNLLYYRADRCHHAASIWESDLEFIANNNFGEDVIDLSESVEKFCKKRGIVFED